MKKVMFYCQYLAGMGHLVRSTEIIRSLVDEFQVCLVNGGQPIVGFEFPADVEVLHLPPILEEDGELKAVNDSQAIEPDIETVKQTRKERLLEIFDTFQPDCLIVECFPFSKHRLKFELIPLLDRAKASSQPVKVVCSLRDLIMTQTMTPPTWAKRYDKICDLVNRYFDLVLVHSDPQLIRLEDQFPEINQLNCMIYYTGYVAQSPPELTALSDEDATALSQETPMILVSAGGGRFGHELLEAVVKASQILETQIPHRIRVFTGPFMPTEDVISLQVQAQGSDRITIRRYTPHLLKYMQQADLSISLGGYNTTMNILRTGVRSLIFPEASEEQTGEQTIRAEKLAQQGVLQVLHRHDLKPDRLAQQILAALQQPPPDHQFNLHGADQSRLQLQGLLCWPALVGMA
jgi:predicted glycosyltransferase